jgi:hypothetical protein
MGLLGTAVNFIILVFWQVTIIGLIDGYQRFEGN